MAELIKLYLFYTCFLVYSFISFDSASVLHLLLHIISRFREIIFHFLDVFFNFFLFFSIIIFISISNFIRCLFEKLQLLLLLLLLFSCCRFC